MLLTSWLRPTTPVLTEEPATAPATHNTSTTNEQMDTICTSRDQTCINNKQTSELETPETDPTTEPINTDDSNCHTPVQRPGPEAATHPLQPPVTDIESNANRVDCPNNELASASVTGYLHTPDDWQKEWTFCFNSVTDSARLGENLAEFFKETKTVHQGTETPCTQTRSEPRQFQHWQQRQRKRWENQYDAITA